MTDPPTESPRLLVLDVLRGLTIAGMVIANDPGDWGHIYPPLRHASWNGITPTDFVFPFFLFVVGVSIALAYAKRLSQGLRPNSMHRKIFTRALMIFGLGIALSLFPQFDFGELRIPGVLQRISIVFLVCSLLFLHSSFRTQGWIASTLLVGYWLAMILVPVPIDETIREALATGKLQRAHEVVEVSGLVQLNEAFVAANLQPGVNLAAWCDRTFIPGRLYEQTWDPEGLLSTFPSIVTGLFGMMAGNLLVRERDRFRQSYSLLLAGFFGVTLGGLWNLFLPFNKNLWSSSFVMYTAGLASMTLGALVWILDIKQWKAWAYVPRVFGANAITAYVVHGTLGYLFIINAGSDGASIKGRFMDGLEASGLDRTFVSLLWALLYTAVVFLPVWWMYRKKIFVKI
ncbi:MAG: heparan-alpha-glucosaminide N-acetyltransferase domain-containing protein [Planctomycetota bacterium]